MGKTKKIDKTDAEINERTGRIYRMFSSLKETFFGNN